MMSGAKKRVPKRRFKEFLNAGDWEQRKLSEVVTINPKTELPDEFKYVDLESVVGTNLLGFKVIKKENAPSRAQRLASYGDVFYQTVRPYQRNNYLFENVDKDVVFSTGYAQLRSKLDSYFLLTLVQNDNFVKVVLDNCTGTSYPAINGSELGKITVQIPSNEVEANQIGKVFRGIDKSITLHQRKLDKLQATKKALLQEMFPEEGQNKPKRRFKGFTDAWEWRKLGECVDISTGYPFDSQDFNENGEYLVITNGNIQENTPFVLSNVGNRIDLDDSLKKYILDIDDLLITMDGTVGRVAIVVDNKLVLAQRVCRIKSNEPYYIYQLLSKNDFIQSMDKIGHGGTIKHISLSEISEYQAFYPKSQKERIKISTVLTNYDKLITLHQRKLDKLKNLKQAYLNEMFV